MEENTYNKFKDFIPTENLEYFKGYKRAYLHPMVIKTIANFDDMEWEVYHKQIENAVKKWETENLKLVNTVTDIAKTNDGRTIGVMFIGFSYDRENADKHEAISVLKKIEAQINFYLHAEIELKPIDFAVFNDVDEDIFSMIVANNEEIKNFTDCQLTNLIAQDMEQFNTIKKECATYFIKSIATITQCTDKDKLKEFNDNLVKSIQSRLDTDLEIIYNQRSDFNEDNYYMTIQMIFVAYLGDEDSDVREINKHIYENVHPICKSLTTENNEIIADINKDDIVGCSYNNLTEGKKDLESIADNFFSGIRKC